MHGSFLSKRNDKAGTGQITRCCRIEPDLTDDVARHVETTSLNLHGTSDIEHSVSCQVLAENPHLANTGAEVKRYALEVAKHGEGSKRIGDVDGDFAFRHEPTPAGESALVASDGYSSVRAPRGKDEGRFVFCLHLR